MLEYHRHRHRREQATDPEELPEITESAPFEEVWNAEWQRKLIEVALQSVEEKPRNLLIYQSLALQEIPVVEVCKLFGISRSNADTIKNRVKKRLALAIRELDVGNF